MCIYVFIFMNTGYTCLQYCNDVCIYVYKYIYMYALYVWNGGGVSIPIVIYYAAFPT